MADLERRLLTAFTALMPPSRRSWGQAMIVELGHTHRRRDRVQLVLAAARIALLPPAGLGDYARAAVRACLLGVVASIPLVADLYLTNVVFPERQDNVFDILLMWSFLAGMLVLSGVLARRATARPGAAAVAGIVAGLVIAVIGMATFAVIDNVFLSVVSHQQGKIDGFRASGMTSMRDYINADLRASALGVAVELAVMGALLGSLGSVFSLRPARSR